MNDVLALLTFFNILMFLTYSWDWEYDSVLIIYISVWSYNFNTWPKQTVYIIFNMGTAIYNLML